MVLNLSLLRSIVQTVCAAMVVVNLCTAGNAAGTWYFIAVYWMCNLIAGLVRTPKIFNAARHEGDEDCIEPGDIYTIETVLDDGAILPTRAHLDDAGMDIHSPQTVTVPAYGSVVVDTGIHIAIPEGFAGLMVSKSGLNMRGLTSTGLIDPGYTGSIRVKLRNDSCEAYEVQRGDKITQLVFVPFVTFECLEVEALKETHRGNGGFGSTGR